MNLAQHLNRFYQDLAEPDTNRYSIALVKEWLDEAEGYVNREAPFIYSESITDALSGTPATSRLYSFPSDLLYYHIDDIYFSDNGDTQERKRLKPIDVLTLDRWDRLWRDRSGTPEFWYIDTEAAKWGVYKTPNNLGTLTDMVKIDYRAKHTKMTRYYTTGTVALTNGSATVTGTSTTFTGNVAAGDQIGVGALLDSSTAFPSTWYTISSVDSDTQLTLTSTYAEATTSGASYIGCANSSITFDELSFSTILLAMGMAKRKDGEEGAKQSLDVEATTRLRAEKYRIERANHANEPSVPLNTIPQPRGRSDDYGLGY
jgi:hypothetical protein